MMTPSTPYRLRPGELQLLLSQCWWAGRLCVWLCWLPIRLRRHPLPALLHRLTPVRGRQQRRRSLEMDRAVWLVVRLCRRRCCRRPLFPRACLRQALTLYYVLTRLGYVVEIHFGIQKAGQVLRGHSWVTVQGQPVAERTRTELFPTIYTFPALASGSAAASADLGRAIEAGATGMFCATTDFERRDA